MNSSVGVARRRHRYAMSKVCINSYPLILAKNLVNLHYICVQCGRQFIDFYELQGYSEEIKRECLEMYVNGSGFPAIERVKKYTIQQ